MTNKSTTINLSAQPFQRPSHLTNNSLLPAFPPRVHAPHLDRVFVPKSHVLITDLIRQRPQPPGPQHLYPKAEEDLGWGGTDSVHEALTVQGDPATETQSKGHLHRHGCAERRPAHDDVTRLVTLLLAERENKVLDVLSLGSGGAGTRREVGETPTAYIDAVCSVQG